MSDELCAIADQRGVSAIRRHVFLCCDQTKPNCCTKEQGLASWDYLKKRLDELKLAGAGGIYRTKANCFRICQGGPICVVYPEGTWYPRLHARSARAHHPGTPDRRETGRGIPHRATSPAGAGGRVNRFGFL